LRRLPQLVSAQFQVLFHSPTGVLFTFPSRYWFTIGHQLVFSLGGWALRIQTGFHVSRPTWDTSKLDSSFAYESLTLYGWPSQTILLLVSNAMLRSRNPKVQAPWFRLFRVRSPLLTESLLFSIPQGTEMFHFPWCRSIVLFYSDHSIQSLHWMGCPIRKSPDQSVFAAPRSLSQLTTSFFAC
jgi:hypothetical protein